MWIQTKISSRHSWPQICDVHQTANDLKEQFTLNPLLLSADGSPLSVSGAPQWDNVTWCSESRRQFLLSAPVQMFSSDFYAHEKTRCCQDGFWLDVKEPRLSIIRRRTEWTVPLSVKASILKMILEQKFNTAHVQETLQVFHWWRWWWWRWGFIRGTDNKRWMLKHERTQRSNCMLETELWYS